MTSLLCHVTRAEQSVWFDHHNWLGDGFGMSRRKITWQSVALAFNDIINMFCTSGRSYHWALIDFKFHSIAMIVLLGWCSSCVYVKIQTDQQHSDHVACIVNCRHFFRMAKATVRYFINLIWMRLKVTLDKTLRTNVFESEQVCYLLSFIQWSSMSFKK